MSTEIYLYLYSQFFFDPNIFVFVLGPESCFCHKLHVPPMETGPPQPAARARHQGDGKGLRQGDKGQGEEGLAKTEGWGSRQGPGSQVRHLGDWWHSY